MKVKSLLELIGAVEKMKDANQEANSESNPCANCEELSAKLNYTKSVLKHWRIAFALSGILTAGIIGTYYHLVSKKVDEVGAKSAEQFSESKSLVQKLADENAKYAQQASDYQAIAKKLVDEKNQAEKEKNELKATVNLLQVENKDLASRLEKSTKAEPVPAAPKPAVEEKVAESKINPEKLTRAYVIDDVIKNNRLVPPPAYLTEKNTKPHKSFIESDAAVINAAFDNADIYSYIGIITDKGAGNRAANYGGDKPLYVGKGKKIAAHLTIDEKASLLSKSSSEWKRLFVKGGKIDSEEIYSRCIEIKQAKFGELVNACEFFGVKDDINSHFVDVPKWKSLTNGSIDFDCEVRDDHLFLYAIYNDPK
jgi:hypothetical protein